MACQAFATLRCENGHEEFMSDAKAATAPCQTCGSTVRKRVGGGIVCSRTRRARCSGCGDMIQTTTMALCDWKLGGAKVGKTCSAKLCARCAREVAPDKHLCPPHARLWDAHPRNPKNLASSGNQGTA